MNCFIYKLKSTIIQCLAIHSHVYGFIHLYIHVSSIISDASLALVVLFFFYPFAISPRAYTLTYIFVEWIKGVEKTWNIKGRRNNFEMCAGANWLLGNIAQSERVLLTFWNNEAKGEIEFGMTTKWREWALIHTAQGRGGAKFPATSQYSISFHPVYREKVERDGEKVRVWVLGCNRNRSTRQDGNSWESVEIRQLCFEMKACLCES